MSDYRRLKVGITQGDINGIGYEVIAGALEDDRILELCTPVVYGSAKIAAYYRKITDSANIPYVQIQGAAEATGQQYYIVNVADEELRVEPGVPSKAAGEAAWKALEKAVADLKAGELDVLVTAPIDKHSIQNESFSFPGHTEYLQTSLGEPGDRAMMIMCSPLGLRVALVTGHIALEKAVEMVQTQLVKEKIHDFDISLKRDFGIDRPRIAVLSLNPHAGEEGLMGDEETTQIIPAIEECFAEGIQCFGPYPSDGLFGSGAFTRFDGILAMYHDQGLTPFKTIAMDSGVNFTAGLPFIRTSPDHGTAYDIAGKGEASAESMRQAIYTAIDISRNRRNFDKARKNPLRKQYFEKNKSDNVVLDLNKTEDHHDLPMN